ncbi:UNVERIFIED_CONTAM: Retrovirus-related Pol polyprotein from transposon opus [Sesamum indicum]
MCIDFRDPNKACRKGFYPLPQSDQLVDSISGCQFLSTMDASQGYHQVMLAPEDCKKVSFITFMGTFCYMAMLFGLKNAGATYQRLVDEIFHPQIGRNRSLCDDTCKQDFEGIKQYLARLPLLMKPSPRDTLYVYLSATPQAASSVLIREEEGKQMPIYYIRKVLNGAEERYTLIEKMALALVTTARRLRPYFLSYPIRVKTNLPLKETLGKPDTSMRLVKWVVA